MRYIALLRGINVGGNNKIEMPKLKAAFEKANFNNVVTYINSGNVLFDTDLMENATKTLCEKIIKENFNLDIAVCIISVSELKKALANAPSWWDTGTESKHNAIFVIPPMTTKELYLKIGETKPEYEQSSYYGNVIFWSTPLATFSHTRFSKIVLDKKTFGFITIRNANTTKKIANF